jgi:hypothetical protein
VISLNERAILLVQGDVRADVAAGSEFDIVSAPEGSRWQAIGRHKRAGIAGLDVTWFSVRFRCSPFLATVFCGSYASV